MQPALLELGISVAVRNMVLEGLHFRVDGFAGSIQFEDVVDLGSCAGIPTLERCDDPSKLSRVDQRMSVFRNLVKAIGVGTQDLYAASIIVFIRAKSRVGRDHIDCIFLWLLPNFELHTAKILCRIHAGLIELVRRGVGVALEFVVRPFVGLLFQPHRIEEDGACLLESVLFRPRLLNQSQRVVAELVIVLVGRVVVAPHPGQLLGGDLNAVFLPHFFDTAVFLVIRRIDTVTLEIGMGTVNALVVFRPPACEQADLVVRIALRFHPHIVPLIVSASGGFPNVEAICKVRGESGFECLQAFDIIPRAHLRSMAEVHARRSAKRAASFARPHARRREHNHRPVGQFQQVAVLALDLRKAKPGRQILHHADQFQTRFLFVRVRIEDHVAFEARVNAIPEQR